MIKRQFYDSAGMLVQSLYIDEVDLEIHLRGKSLIRSEELLVMRQGAVVYGDFYRFKIRCHGLNLFSPATDPCIEACCAHALKKIYERIDAIPASESPKPMAPLPKPAEDFLPLIVRVNRLRRPRYSYPNSW